MFVGWVFSRALLFSPSESTAAAPRTPRTPSSAPAPTPPLGTPGPATDEEELPESADATWRADLDSFRLFLLSWAYHKLRYLSVLFSHTHLTPPSAHFFGGSSKEMTALLQFVLPFVRWSGRFNYTLAIIDFLCRLHGCEPKVANLFLANHFMCRVRVDGTDLHLPLILTHRQDAPDLSTTSTSSS
jgi:hypothetical protein